MPKRQPAARRCVKCFTSHSREVVCGLGTVIALTVTIYVLISYLPTFAVKQLKLPYAQSFYAVIVGNLLLDGALAADRCMVGPHRPQRACRCGRWC